MEQPNPDLVFDFKKTTPGMNWMWFGEVFMHQVALGLQAHGVPAHAMERKVVLTRHAAFSSDIADTQTKTIPFVSIAGEDYTQEGPAQWGKILRGSYKELRKQSKRGYSDEGERCLLTPATPHLLARDKVRGTDTQMHELGALLLANRAPRPPARKLSQWAPVFQGARPHDHAPVADLDGVEALLADYYRTQDPQRRETARLGAGLHARATRGRNRPPAWLIRRPVVYASDTLLLLDHRMALEYGHPQRRVCVSHPGCWEDLTIEQKRLDPHFDPANLRLGMVSGAEHALREHPEVDLRNMNKLRTVVAALDTGAQHATLQAKTTPTQDTPRRGPRL